MIAIILTVFLVYFRLFNLGWSEGEEQIILPSSNSWSNMESKMMNCHCSQRARLLSCKQGALQFRFHMAASRPFSKLQINSMQIIL